MTTDRELLELAAKAAGIEFYTPEGMDEPWFALTYQSGFYLRGCKVWNPLVDDGDALRLAVKLWLEVRHVHGAAHAGMQGQFWCSEAWFPDGDANAATRRAVVRAAASIGQQVEK